MKTWLAGFLSAALLAVSSSVSFGQSWPSWADEIFGRRQSELPRELERKVPRVTESKPLDVRDGGPRPTIQAEAPPIVPFAYAFKASSIVIDVGKRKLYYVLPENRAFEYSIGVGREGFGWTGKETISRKQEWPDWHPPAEMRERDPSLPEKMTGGLKNPLGAVALYLGTTLLSHSRYERCGFNRQRGIFGLLQIAECAGSTPGGSHRNRHASDGDRQPVRPAGERGASSAPSSTRHTA
jgi:lipoprotein-anchoring transpeptidase ErfK/SrfK